MLIRLVCILAHSSLCLSSPLDRFEKELKKKGLDVDKIHEVLKRESEDVEEEFAGNETQEKLAELRAAYSTATNGTNEVETEMEINGELSEDLFEGDIILTPEQWARVMNRDAKATRQRRQALTDVRDLWAPMGSPVIPYSYSDGFPPEGKKIITDSLEFWASRTCITFRLANETDKNFIEFNHNSSGCSSALGMSRGKQQLKLPPTCFTKRLITHELSHAFGAMHVQSRYDREKYITVNWGNIRKGEGYNFIRDPFGFGEHGIYNISYEFGSLMHYNQNNFAINRTQPTMFAMKDYTQYQHSMGSPIASFYDILLINRMYNCTAKCKNQIECDNNGVQDGFNCSRCYCPKGWAGNRCEERPKTANVTNLTGSMEITMEADAAPRKGYAEKLYVIQAPIGKRINASVKWMEECQDCWLYRYFEIIPTKDTRINGIHFFGKPNTTTIESESNEMLVWMYNRALKKMSTQIIFTLV